MKHVITATDDNPDYFFFLPIVTKMWEKMGFQHHCVVIADPAKLTEALRTAISHSKGAVLHFVNPNNVAQNFPGFQPWALAPLSRILAGCLDIPKNDCVLTSDIDMLPIKQQWFDKISLEPNNIDIFGEDGATGGYGNSRYPICYVGMQRALWSTILQTHEFGHDFTLGLNHLITKYRLDTLDINGQRACDEPLLHSLINDHSRKYRPILNFHMRKMITNESYKPGMIGVPGILPEGRLDRSNWQKNMTGVIDIHAPRPGYSQENWDKLKYQLQTLYSPLEYMEVGMLNWYREEFIGDLNEKHTPQH